MTYEARNLAIYDAANAVGREYGVITQLAHQYGLSRARVSAIILRMDVKLQKQARPKYSHRQTAFFTGQYQSMAFTKYCIGRNWDATHGLRAAVALLLASPDYRGKEEPPYSCSLGPWRTTQAQHDAFKAFREARSLTYAEAMRTAISILLDTTTQ
jgi:hypothetical protein